MGRVQRGLAAGIAGGLVATLLMSILMLAARRAGLSGRLPPDRIAEKAIEETTDREATPHEERVVASVSHLAFGAAGGALFGALVSAVPRLPLAALAGIGAVYASGIWLVSYQGWVPGLGIMPPAHRDRPGRVATMVGGHWVYGVSLGALTGLLRDALKRPG